MATRVAKILAFLSIAGMVVIILGVLTLNDHFAHSSFHTNTSLVPQFSVLGFLAAGAGLVFAVLVVLGALLTGNRGVAAWTLVAALAGVIFYAAMLLGFSRASRDVVLGPGEEKYFCEADCHIAYAVVNEARQDDLLRVDLRTRFDERTAAPWRGDSPFPPNPRIVELVDGAGHRYAPSRILGESMMKPVRPGESYISGLEFHVPPSTHDLRLLVISEEGFPECVMIGNEKSFLHHKVMFRL